MSFTLVTFKTLSGGDVKHVTPPPPGDGGLGLNNNFENIANSFSSYLALAGGTMLGELVITKDVHVAPAILIQDTYSSGATSGNMIVLQDNNSTPRTGIAMGIASDGGYSRVQYVNGSSSVYTSCSSGGPVIQFDALSTHDGILAFSRSNTWKWSAGIYGTSSDFSFYGFGTPGNALTMYYSTGNLGVATTSDDGTHKLQVNGGVSASSFSGSGTGLTSIPNSATTAASANTASAIVARDSSGNFSAGVISAATFSGTGGTGPVILKAPIQLDTGGSTRGTNALDLQTTRTSTSQVASGSFSMLRGVRSTASGNYSSASGYRATVSGQFSSANGYRASASGTYSSASGYRAIASGYLSNSSGWICTASGYYSASSGNNSSATAIYSSASGLYSLASKRGQSARNSFSFYQIHGDNQRTVTHLGAATVDATQTELTTDGAGPTGSTEPTSNRFIVVQDKSYGCLITVMAFQSVSGGGANAGVVAHFVRQLTVKNIGGTVSISAVGLIADINPALWGLTFAANSTQPSLRVLVTGAASSNIRWRATIQADEIIYS